MTAMKVRIDSGLCAGHGRCWTLAGDVYAADDDGFAQPQDEAIEVSPTSAERATRGAKGCPEGAIQIIQG